MKKNANTQVTIIFIVWWKGETATGVQLRQSWISYLLSKGELCLQNIVLKAGRDVLTSGFEEA